MAEHQLKPGVLVVLVWNQRNFIATIYPTERGIKVVSKYIADNPEGAIEIDKLPPVPAILINLI